MLNQITIMGRLTAAPELRRTQNDVAVTSFRLAVDRDRADAEGERKTDFISVTAWRGTAEFIQKYFQKGSMAIVTGRLQMRDWTDRDGNKRTSAEVLADHIYFGETKAKQDRQETEQEHKSSKPASAPVIVDADYQPVEAHQGKFSELDDDGELPFD